MSIVYRLQGCLLSYQNNSTIHEIPAFSHPRSILPICSSAVWFVHCFTEKQVHLGRLRIRPIQWYLKNHWRTPESLEKVIPVPRSTPTPKLNP